MHKYLKKQQHRTNVLPMKMSTLYCLPSPIYDGLCYDSLFIIQGIIFKQSKLGLIMAL